MLAYNIGVKIESNGKHYMRPMLTKNMQIPCEETREFFTSTDYQEKLEIQILQGQNQYSEDNLQLGILKVYLTEDVAMRKAGKNCIIVTFNVDVNHRLTVKAVDKKSGKSKIMQQDFRGEGMNPQEKDLAKYRVA